ncbi:hypothetical protein PHET_07226 [Paragonimus heterotremus]|uniref:Uncharacterized protein n=1 Tax=Paragonimus heterotremus TaxID=100268 RepID=A0A8J4T693_9TREM|nr:hypothetical protein PHET_07226 [Paragonimus heterotremus]
MFNFLRPGFEDFPTSLGPHGEVILNLARRELDRIDLVPQNVNVLILDHNYIRRLENLVNLNDLQQLSVAGNKLYQMHGVAHLINLTILNLPNNGIVAIDGLAKLTQLRWLNLSANRLRSADQLEGNVNLKHLDVSENYIGQLSDISYLPRLKTFLLHCNRIQTLANAGRLLPRSLEIFSLASNLVGNLADVQQLTLLPNLVQFSLQNNPCTAFPPEDYEPLILAHLPKLQILNGISVQPEMRAKAQQLHENKQGLDAFIIPTASQRSPVVALTPPHSDPPPLSITPPVHLPSSPDSVASVSTVHTDAATVPMNSEVPSTANRLQNPIVDGSRVVPVTEDTVKRPDQIHIESVPNFGPVTPKQPILSTKETDTMESNKSAGEHQSAHCVSMATEHNDLPAVSFRSIFAEKSTTNPMNDFKCSPIRQYPQPAVIQCLPPTDAFANSPSHMPQGSANLLSNPVACSLLMSESVYLPVGSSLSPTDQRLNLSSDPQSTPVPSSLAGTPFLQYPPRSVCSGPSSAASGCYRFQPSTSALSDSLDLITSHELDSSRTTTTVDGNGLRQTLQSSVSLIPLNKSSDSVEATSVCTHTPRDLSAVPFSNGTVHRLTAGHPTNMIDSVHLLNDEEDNEERAASHLNVSFHPEGLTDRIPSHMTRSYPTDPATSGFGNSSNSLRLSAPNHSEQNATPTDRLRLDQLLLRSHPMQGETVA